MAEHELSAQHFDFFFCNVRFKVENSHVAEMSILARALSYDHLFKSTWSLEETREQNTGVELHVVIQRLFLDLLQMSPDFDKIYRSNAKGESLPLSELVHE